MKYTENIRFVLLIQIPMNCYVYKTYDRKLSQHEMIKASKSLGRNLPPMHCASKLVTNLNLPPLRLNPICALSFPCSMHQDKKKCFQNFGQNQSSPPCLNPNLFVGTLAMCTKTTYLSSSVHQHAPKLPQHYMIKNFGRNLPSPPCLNPNLSVATLSPPVH